MNLCPYCNGAKALLNAKKATFTEVNVDSDDVKREWIARHTGQTSLPQLFIDNISYGGFEEMQDLDKKGKLNSILGLK